MALREDAAIPVGKAAAAAIAWRFRGELRVTAIVKATFAVAPDVAMTRVEPEPIAPSDLAPYRKRADVIFTGGAAAGVDVGMSVAGGAKPLLDKSVPSAPAAGASFGPLPRAASLPDWAVEVTDIPGTFDWDLVQAAPADQRTDYLRGDEWIVIEGLVPGHAELRARLPGARAHGRIYGLSRWRLAEGKALAMNADVVHLRGDDLRCTVTWRGSFAVADDAALDAVRIVVAVELPGEPIAWPDRAKAQRAARADATLPLPDAAAVPVAPAPARAPRRASPDATLPIDAASPAGSPLLPFIKAPSAAPPAVAPAEPRPRRAARSGADATLPVPEGKVRRSTLPFEAVKGPPAEPPEPPPPEAAASRPEPPPTPVEPRPAVKPPAREIQVASPSTEEHRPPPAQRPAEKKLPPKVDVAGKLYGPGKKR